MRSSKRVVVTQVPTWLLVASVILFVVAAMFIARHYFYDKPRSKGFTPAQIELDAVDVWHVGVIATFEMLRCSEGNGCLD